MRSVLLALCLPVMAVGMLLSQAVAQEKTAKTEEARKPAPKTSPEKPPEEVRRAVLKAVRALKRSAGPGDAPDEKPAEEPKPEQPSTGQPAKPQPAAAPASVASNAEEEDPGIKLYLRDGSIITGEFVIENLQVTTEFGKLNVPIEKIEKFVPGLLSHADLNSRITALIEDLGGDDYKKREAAEAELGKMGPKVARQLEPYREDKNVERSRRVKALLQKFEQLTEDLSDDEPQQELIPEDTIETPDFTMVGRISPESFQIKNRFGLLTVKLEHIKVAQRGRAKKDATREFPVEGRYMAQTQFKSSGVQVYKGDRVAVRATGQIQRVGSTSYNSSPDGNSSRLGTYVSGSPTIYGGALVARIGRSGKIFKVGSRTEFAADSDGVLYFAIGMSSSYVRYRFTGQYNLQLRVQRGGQ